MRIAFFEVEEWEREFIQQRLGSRHDVTFSADTLGDSNAAEAAEADVLSVFINSPITAERLASLPNVRLVVTRSMGYDHIDLAACAARNVTVSRVPAYGDRTVAEHAFALILALSRKIFLAYERTERGTFDYHGLQGFDLYGKTIGIVGMGRIGQNAARIAKGFGMRVLSFDTHPRPELAAEIGFEYAPLEVLLAESDVVTLHCPAVPETHHLLNAERFAMMKKGAILVNTARGSLVDTKALLAALEQGTLSGAGLDVLEEEGFIKEERELMASDFPKKLDLSTIVRNHMLIARNDVIITPHIAFNSREAVERILQTTVDDIEGFVRGSSVNQVTA